MTTVSTWCAGVLSVFVFIQPAGASWKAAKAEVAAAAKDPKIAGALEAVNAIDRAAVGDDTAGFAALLADDLAVNNPQNGVSVRGATAQRSAAGQDDDHACEGASRSVSSEDARSIGLRNSRPRFRCWW